MTHNWRSNAVKYYKIKKSLQDKYCLHNTAVKDLSLQVNYMSKSYTTQHVTLSDYILHVLILTVRF